MKKAIYLFPLLIGILACGTQPRLTQATAPYPTSSSQTAIVSTQLSPWISYSNSKYGYSLSYPSIYTVKVISDEYVEIGEKMVMEVWDKDPTTALGDGPVVESATDVQLPAGYSAKLLTGYIGSIGGNIPQQFRRYVIKQNNHYFIATLYALGLHTTEGDISQIAQIDPNEIPLFDSVVTSIKIS